MSGTGREQGLRDRLGVRGGDKDDQLDQFRLGAGERVGILHAESGAQPIVESVGGAVEVGMRGEQVEVAGDRGARRATRRVAGRKRLERSQKQRVVGQQRLAA